MDNPDSRPPSMLSAGFHLRFFPALLKSRFGNNVPQPGTSFVGAAFKQGALVLYGSVAAAAAGAPLLPGVAGWLLLALAAAGVLSVIVFSVLQARGIAPVYECFLFPLFFFCVALGLAAGALAGLNEPAWVRVIYGCAGVALGYWAGLLAGYYGQRLGFITVLLYPFALAGSIGILLTALLLLST